MHWNSCCCYSKAFWPEITAVARISPGKSSEIQLLWLCLFICFHITVMPEVTHMQSWKLSHSGKMSLGSFQGMEGAEGKPCTSPILSWAFVSWVLALAEWTCVSSSGFQSVLWNRKTQLLLQEWAAQSLESWLGGKHQLLQFWADNLTARNFRLMGSVSLLCLVCLY